MKSRNSGVLKLDNEFLSISSGDFVGFPANGATHSMKNTGSVDLVYFMGGNRVDTDCCNYTDIKKRLYKINGRNEYVDTDQLNNA